MIEETKAQRTELECALIQTLVTMRQERGGAMVKNGKGKGKPNSAEKVSSQSVLLEERQTVRVTGGTADSESDSTRVRCSSDVVSLIERQG